ncbi:MAG: hypothetical protein DMF29_05740 [Verrucomicrobia bacterium]|nr:MAG: hypothetical protein DMF29_05740 [Verrucomicrobiota bacterium]
MRLQIRPGAPGKTEVPHFVWTKTNSTAECRIFQANVGHVPRFWPRRERGVFQFECVIEFLDRAQNGKAARVARPPNDRKP